MFKKIMICSDGSEGALTAAQLGAQIAQKFQSDVLLIHTYDLAVAAYPTFEAGIWNLPITEQGMDSYAAEARLALEEHTGQILKDANVSYETRIERGHPVETITRLAQQVNADLIVLGSRGQSDVLAFLMGSVSEGVLHHAHCPVLIVRDGNARGQAQELPRILLASDGSAGACQATTVALEIARKFAASLSVLNVLDASSIAYRLSPYLPSDNENPHTNAERLLTKITNDVSKAAIQAGVPRSFHQETGNPAEIIVRFANRTDTSLIVIGCRGRGTFEALLLGSVSNHVAHYAHRSVLVTR